MGFFSRKKKPLKEPSQLAGDSLKKDLLAKCNQNTKNIIAKIVNKREDYYKQGEVPAGKEEEVDSQFQKMIEYMQSVNWSDIIDTTFKNAKLPDVDGKFSNLTDPETAKVLLNIHWQSIKEDINKMINDVIMISNSMEKDNDG